MEDNKNMKLNDEQLDRVSGGYTERIMPNRANESGGGIYGGGSGAGIGSGGGGGDSGAGGGADAAMTDRFITEIKGSDGKSGLV